MPILPNYLDPSITLTLEPEFILDSFAYLLRIDRSRLSIELGNHDVTDAIWVYIDGKEDPFYFEHAFYLNQPPEPHEKPYVYTFAVIDTDVPSSQTRASLSVDIMHPHQIDLDSEAYQRSLESKT